jgi:hypothetical protein
LHRCILVRADEFQFGFLLLTSTLYFVFVGIRNYRDKYNGGVISFGKAFKIGIMMVLIASTIYFIAWLIDYFFSYPILQKNIQHTRLAN